MREIKFRVWDRDIKKMQYNAGVTLSGNSIVDDLNIPMQYTGLKDKTGKEIYEGDIVNIEYDTVNEIGEDSIGYNEDVIIEWNYELLCQLEYDLKGIEIIGNIYENPDLL